LTFSEFLKFLFERFYVRVIHDKTVRVTCLLSLLNCQTNVLLSRFSPNSIQIRTTGCIGKLVNFY